ncbi:MAG: DNA-3-methyladenine glycosylase 2 family protein [Gammaproteobacteria bacterium]|nr:DNA-3-methyladenine glycosylase 2 family protein [Gammaproteobacteria bacterium]
MQLSYQVKLPNNFRVQDFLSFYLRDPHSPTEKIEGQTIIKALMYQQQPALLSLVFTPLHVQAELQIDNPAKGSYAQEPFNAWIEHITGLQQDVSVFEQAFLMHPQLGAIIQKQQGLRFAQTTTPFEALSWAILGQQVSVAAAVSLRRKLIQLINHSHSSGFLCYPNAQQVSQFSVEQLRSVGLSNTKAQALQTVSQQIAGGVIQIDYQSNAQQIEQLQEQLLSIRGIGPWTVNYTLMRGCAWLDSSVHGDAAVQRYLKVVLNQETISAKQTQAWLAQFTPWRALAAAHLWQSAGLAA